MALLTDQILASGVTSSDLIHIVITGNTSQNPAGSSFKASVAQVATAIGSPGFSGGTVPYNTYFSNSLSANTFSATTYLNLPGSSSGGCLSDFYVQNIHSCSPLYINPLNEGPIIFGQSSQVYMNLTNKYVGFNNPNPIYNIDAFGSLGGRFYFRGATSPAVQLSGGSTVISSKSIVAGLNGIEISVIGDTFPSTYAGLISGDTLIGTTSSADNLAIATLPGASLQKNIKFFAGKTPDNKPDLVIVGTGTTRGYVGINLLNPQEPLHIDGKTRTENFQMTSGATQGYVLVDNDGNGNAKWTKMNQVSGKNWISSTSSVDQTLSVAGTTLKMSADTSSGNGITLSANTRFVVSTPGVYNIQFSAQLEKTTGTKSEVYIWLIKNGTNEPNSNTQVTLDGANGDRVVASWNFVDEAVSSNTYYEIGWTASDNNTFISHDATPVYGPAIPSLIVTITQI